MQNQPQVIQALQTILDNASQPALNYAVNYARAALHMTGRELQVQLLYVLNNMSHWRGPIAKQVRETLRAATRGV
jgi:hypothetical protein